MITLNGRPFSPPSTCLDLCSLLTHLSITAEHVILDVNGTLIKGADATQLISTGDVIEIVHFMGGGAHLR